MTARKRKIGSLVSLLPDSATCKQVEDSPNSLKRRKTTLRSPCSPLQPLTPNVELVLFSKRVTRSAKKFQQDALVQNVENQGETQNKTEDTGVSEAQFSELEPRTLSFESESMSGCPTVVSRMVGACGNGSTTSECARDAPSASTETTKDTSPAIETWDPSDQASTMRLRRLFHLSAGPSMEAPPCREGEYYQIEEFCWSHLTSIKPGSLYISGCPGTGKSMCVGLVQGRLAERCKLASITAPVVVNVNCMALSEPKQVFSKVLSALSRDSVMSSAGASRMAGKSVLDQLKEALWRPREKGMVLLILDEMDQLLTKEQSLLYDIFCLTVVPNSRCIIIGIANSVDLTDRFLPKLHALHCKPAVMTFPAYSKAQLHTILQRRIEAIPGSPFDAAALELCARKVASSTGDIRKALDVCRIAVECFEADVPASGGTVPGDAKDKKVRIHHMARALAASFRSPVVDTIQALPQHQQVVLCSVVQLFGRGRKDATLGEVNAAYIDVCRKAALDALTASEFGGVCMVLADQGLLSLGSAREERKRRITLKIHQDDVLFALQGIRFFRNLMGCQSLPSGTE